MSVTLDTGIRSDSLFVAAYKIIYDFFLKSLTEIEDVIRHSELVGYGSGVFHIEQHECSLLILISLLPKSFMVTPIQSYPFSFIRHAATLESTPPLIAISAFM